MKNTGKYRAICKRDWSAPIVLVGYFNTEQAAKDAVTAFTGDGTGDGITQRMNGKWQAKCGDNVRYFEYHDENAAAMWFNKQASKKGSPLLVGVGRIGILK